MITTQNDSLTTLPIGVFDSGVGGLTVLRALHERLPQESFLYLGDTARLPYGTKSSRTVVQYATQACEALVELGVKALVVACNTASAYALPTLQERFPTVPILGVIEPGAKAAVAASQCGRIAVIATEATIHNQAYEHAILALNSQAIVSGTSCSLFVALAEEGWVQGDIVAAVAKEYLAPLFAQPQSPDCLVLGCTHFPALLPAIQQVLPPSVVVVDSAHTTAEHVKQVLKQRQLQAPCTKVSKMTFFVTDNPQRFIRVARNLLQMDISPGCVELIDI